MSDPKRQEWPGDPENVNELRQIEEAAADERVRKEKAEADAKRAAEAAAKPQPTQGEE